MARLIVLYQANLINSGILPLVFIDEKDYEKVNEMEEVKLISIEKSLIEGVDIVVASSTDDCLFKVRFIGSQRDIETILKGGTINYLRQVTK